MSKHLFLAKKLKELAERGVGGEKVNAEKMLNDLLKKHNISLEEIDEEKTNDYFFNVSDKIEWKLLFQIVKKVNFLIPCYGEFPKNEIKKYSLKGNYMITCTASEYIEIEAKHTFFYKLFLEEVKIFQKAFIRANDLLIDNPNQKGTIEDLTQEEYLELLRIQDMVSKIKKGVFNKQLDPPK